MGLIFGIIVTARNEINKSKEITPKKKSKFQERLEKMQKEYN